MFLFNVKNFNLEEKRGKSKKGKHFVFPLNKSSLSCSVGDLKCELIIFGDF
jgi:hypothetical protein